MGELAHERGQALDHRHDARRSSRVGLASARARHEDTQVGGQVQEEGHEFHHHRHRHCPAG
eukprot:8807762-Alexandrium_andersonii.AAC.1